TKTRLSPSSTLVTTNAAADKASMLETRSCIDASTFFMTLSFHPNFETAKPDLAGDPPPTLQEFRVIPLADLCGIFRGSSRGKAEDHTNDSNECARVGS